MDSLLGSGSGSGLGTGLDLLGMFTPKGHDYASGTGLKQVSTDAKDTFEDSLESLIPIIKTQLPALFGDYPGDKDVAPTAIFIAVFSILFIACLGLFSFNFSRGHKFYPLLGLAVHSLWKVIGFGIRIKWSGDVLNVPIAVASVVFTQVPPLVLCVINVYLGSRIYTWRHPEAGRALWFRATNGFIYFLVVGVIIMAIVGTSLPNLQFMTKERWHKCQQVAQAASVLQIVYALGGAIMLCAAYAFKPGKIDHKFVFGKKDKTEEDYPYVIQPTWLQKFSPFYTVPKHAGRVVGKNEGVIRIIPSSETPAHGLIRSVNVEEGSQGPKIMTANGIIIISSLALVLLSCFRCASMFITGPRGGGEGEPFINVTYRSTIFYVFYGAVEALVVIFWLVVRIDLRFYIPEVGNPSVQSNDAAPVHTVTSAEEKDQSVYSANNQA